MCVHWWLSSLWFSSYIYMMNIKITEKILVMLCNEFRTFQNWKTYQKFSSKKIMYICDLSRCVRTQYGIEATEAYKKHVKARLGFWGSSVAMIVDLCAWMVQLSRCIGTSFHRWFYIILENIAVEQSYKMYRLYISSKFLLFLSNFLFC